MSSCARGYEHSLFLDEFGNAWACGNNQYGQLGLGDNNQRTTPERINNLPPITSVSVGNLFVS